MISNQPKKYSRRTLAAALALASIILPAQLLAQDARELQQERAQATNSKASIRWSS